MFIDTHCHLNLKEFDEDLQVVITNAKKADVKKFIVPGVDYYSSKKSLELSEKYPGTIFSSVGFHPYEAQHIQDLKPIYSMLSTAIAIGECGLDYHMYKDEEALGKKSAQKLLFAAHLRLAIKHDLPVIIHCRDAFNDLFDVLDSIPTMPRGVIHCFSGGLQDLRMLYERGLYVGIDGNVTYAKKLVEVIQQMRLDKLLLETDSPNLTPVPFRGQRNEPKHLPLVSATIAQILGAPKQMVAQQTTQNALQLFRL